MNEIETAKYEVQIVLTIFELAAKKLRRDSHTETQDYANYLRRLVKEGWAEKPNGSCQVLSMRFQDPDQVDKIREELKNAGVPVMWEKEVPETLVIPQSCYEKMQAVLSANHLSNNLEQYPTKAEFDQIHRELIDSKKLFNSDTVKDANGDTVLELTPLGGNGNCSQEDLQLFSDILTAHGIDYTVVDKDGQTALQIPYGKQYTLDILAVSNGYDICYNDPKKLQIHFSEKENLIEITDPENTENLFEFEAYLKERGFDYRFLKKEGKIQFYTDSRANRDILCDMSNQARQQYGFSGLEADFNSAFGLVRGEHSPSGAGQFVFYNDTPDKSYENWLEPYYQKWAKRQNLIALANTPIDLSRMPEENVVQSHMQRIQDRIVKNGDPALSEAEKDRLTKTLERADHNSRFAFHETAKDRNHDLHVMCQFYQTLRNDPDMFRKLAEDDAFDIQIKNISRKAERRFAKSSQLSDKVLLKYYQSKAAQIRYGLSDQEREDMATLKNTMEDEALASKNRSLCPEGFENYAYQCGGREKEAAEARMQLAAADLEKAGKSGATNALEEAKANFDQAKKEYTEVNERINRAMTDPKLIAALKELDRTKDPAEAAHCAEILAKSENAKILFGNPRFYSALEQNIKHLADRESEKLLLPYVRQYDKGILKESEFRKQAGRIGRETYSKVKDARHMLLENRERAEEQILRNKEAREKTELEYKVADIPYSGRVQAEKLLTGIVQKRQDQLDAAQDQAKKDFMQLTPEEQQQQMSRVDGIVTEYIENSSVLRENAALTAGYMAQLDKAMTVSAATAVLAEMSQSPEVCSVLNADFWSIKKNELDSAIEQYVTDRKNDILTSGQSDPVKAQLIHEVEKQAESCRMELSAAVDDILEKTKLEEKSAKDAEFIESAQDTHDLLDSVASLSDEEIDEDDPFREYDTAVEDEPEEYSGAEQEAPEENEYLFEEEPEIDEKALKHQQELEKQKRWDKEREQEQARRESEKAQREQAEARQEQEERNRREEETRRQNEERQRQETEARSREEEQRRAAEDAKRDAERAAEDAKHAEENKHAEEVKRDEENRSQGDPFGRAEEYRSSYDAKEDIRSAYSAAGTNLEDTEQKFREETRTYIDQETSEARQAAHADMRQTIEDRMEPSDRYSSQLADNDSRRFAEEAARRESEEHRRSEHVRLEAEAERARKAQEYIDNSSRQNEAQEPVSRNDYEEAQRQVKDAEDNYGRIDSAIHAADLRKSEDSANLANVQNDTSISAAERARRTSEYRQRIEEENKIIQKLSAQKQETEAAYAKASQTVSDYENAKHNKSMDQAGRYGVPMPGVAAAGGGVAAMHVLGSGNAIPQYDVVINADDDFRVSRKTYMEKHSSWGAIAGLAAKPLMDGVRQTDAYAGYRDAHLDVVVAGAKAAAMNMAHEVARASAVDMFNHKVVGMRDSELAGFSISKRSTTVAEINYGRISYKCVTEDVAKALDFADGKAAAMGIGKWNGKSLSEIVRSGSFDEFIKEMQQKLTPEQLKKLKELGQFQLLALKAGGGFEIVNAGGKMVDKLTQRLVQEFFSFADSRENDAARVMKQAVNKTRTAVRGVKRIKELYSKRAVYRSQARAARDALKRKLGNMKGKVITRLKRKPGPRLTLKERNKIERVKRLRKKVIRRRRRRQARENARDVLRNLKYINRNAGRILKGGVKNAGKALVKGVRANIAERVRRAQEILKLFARLAKGAKIGASAATAAGAGAAAGTAASAAGGAAAAAGGTGLVAALIYAAPIVAAVCLIIFLVSLILILLSELITALAGMEQVVEDPYKDTYMGRNLAMATFLDEVYYRGADIIVGTANTIDELFSYVPFIGGLTEGVFNLLADNSADGLDQPVYIVAEGYISSGLAACLLWGSALDTDIHVFNTVELGETTSGFWFWRTEANKIFLNTSVHFYEQPSNPDGNPIFQTTISELTPVNEGVNIQYIDGNGNITGRSSNIKQILSMTAVVFTTTASTSENQIANEVANNKGLQLITDIWKAFKVVENIETTVKGWVVQIFENVTHFDVPDVLNTSDMVIQQSYIVAAYLASHDMRITYNVNPEADNRMIGMTCDDLLDLPGALISDGLGDHRDEISCGACFYSGLFDGDPYTVHVKRGESVTDPDGNSVTFDYFSSDNYTYDTGISVDDSSIGTPTTDGRVFIAQCDKKLGYNAGDGVLDGYFCAGHPSFVLLLECDTFDDRLFEVIEGNLACKTIETVMQVLETSFFSDSWDFEGNVDNPILDGVHWTEFNRQWAQRLFDRDWQQDYGLAVGNTNGLNYWENTRKKYYLTQEERIAIESNIGNRELSYERYLMIHNALRMCGQINYGDKEEYGNPESSSYDVINLSHPERYIEYTTTVSENQTDVKRDSDGEPKYPNTLNSPQFITWLFASNRMDITGSQSATWTYDDYVSNFGPGKRLQPVIASEMAPGDLLIARGSTGLETVGLFIGWASDGNGGRSSNAYVLMNYPCAGEDYGTVRVALVNSSDYQMCRPACFTEAPYQPETEREGSTPVIPTDDLPEHSDY